MHTLHSNILDIQKTGHRAQYTVGCVFHAMADTIPC